MRQVGRIVAMLGRRDSDEMSRTACADALREEEIDGKHAEDYVAIVEQAELDHLPPGCTSLVTWLARASENLGAAVHGR